MHEYYTTKQMAEKLHCDVRQVARFRQYGLLKSIRTGHGFIYRDDQIDEFWEKYEGMDLSNEEKISTADQVIKTLARGAQPKDLLKGLS